MQKQTPQPVTIETMKNWLRLAYAENSAQGYCAPSKYKLPGRANVCVAARRLGIITARNDNAGHGSVWNMDPLTERNVDDMANKLLHEYVTYQQQYTKSKKGNGVEATPAADQSLEAILGEVNQTLKQINQRMAELLDCWQEKNQ